MKIALFGATGGIGRRVLSEADAAGHVVRALVRDPSRLPPETPIEAITGSLEDAEAVAETVRGTDAVIWAAGATSNSADQVAVFERGAHHLVAAMRQHDVRRLVALSGAGITLEGERKPLAGRLMTWIVRIAARHVYEAKRREYEVFSGSGLDWTLVRPPRVVEGEPTGRIVAGERLAGNRITQADLAAFMLRQVDDRTFVRAAPFVSS